MKAILNLKSLALAWLAASLFTVHADNAKNVTDAIELVRSLYQTDRQAFVAGALDLTERESAAFWPIYKSYRADLEKIGDELVKVVLEYADLYPDVPDDRAARLLDQYLALERKLVAKRAWYFKKAGKQLPAAKALRWAQLENRLDLALHLQLAARVPIVPGDKPRP